jgi:hypothetical protein
MKATLKLNQQKLNRIPSIIRKEVTKELRSKEIRGALGEIVAEEIKQTDQGFPSPGTLDFRERYDTLNKTDPEYNRFQIKMVFTGELLKDLARNVRLSTEGGKIVFTFLNSDKKHKKYQGKTKKIGSQSPYSVIAKGLNDLGYKYPFITDKALSMAREFVRKTILEKLKRTFRVK